MNSNNPDYGFDGIADKFDQNIYGTAKGKVRHAVLAKALTKFIQGEHKLNVLDAGGGTGLMSEVFAKMGHTVTLVDVSKDVLNIAHKSLNKFNNLTIKQDDILNIEGSFDLIICHALLEWLDNPKEYLGHLASLLKLNGSLSLSFFNRDAKEFSNLLYGNFDYIERGMPSRNTVRLNPTNPQRPNDIIDFVTSSLDMTIENTMGVRCFHDYMNHADRDRVDFKQILELEWRYGRKEPYKYLGKYFHILANK